MCSASRSRSRECQVLVLFYFAICAAIEYPGRSFRCANKILVRPFSGKVQNHSGECPKFVGENVGATRYRTTSLLARHNRHNILQINLIGVGDSELHLCRSFAHLSTSNCVCRLPLPASPSRAGRVRLPLPRTGQFKFRFKFEYWREPFVWLHAPYRRPWFVLPDDAFRRQSD